MSYAKSMSQEANEPGLVHLRLVLISAGAAPLATVRGGGLAATNGAVRTGVGQITIKLDKPFLSLVGFNHGLKLAGATATLGCVIISGDGVSSDTLVIETRSGTTPTDLAAGDVLYLHFVYNEIKVIF